MEAVVYKLVMTSTYPRVILFYILYLIIGLVNIIIFKKKTKKSQTTKVRIRNRSTRINNRIFRNQRSVDPRIRPRLQLMRVLERVTIRRGCQRSFVFQHGVRITIRKLRRVE